MEFVVQGVRVNSPEGMGEDEAREYLSDIARELNGRRLLAVDIELEGEQVLIAPHYDTVVRLRRITGYLSDLSKFNEAKRAEQEARRAHF